MWNKKNNQKYYENLDRTLFINIKLYSGKLILVKKI